MFPLQSSSLLLALAYAASKESIANFAFPSALCDANDNRYSFVLRWLHLDN